MVHAAQLEI